MFSFFFDNKQTRTERNVRLYASFDLELFI